MASQPNPDAARQLAKGLGLGLALGAAGGVVATQPELWPLAPALGRLVLQVAH